MFRLPLSRTQSLRMVLKPHRYKFTVAAILHSTDPRSSSHLHPHHQSLPAEYQTTPQGRSAAKAFSSTQQSPIMASDLTLESTLPIPNSTVRIPRLGFGIYQSPPEVCVASCLHALKSGYRHIDSAQYYRNESEMGTAVRESGLNRQDVFLTTKILSAGGSQEKTYQKCVESIQKVDPGDKGYVDLFLIHSPSGGPAAIKEMWQALERLHDEGRVKSLGVSNFGKGRIEEMKSWAKVWPPQVNQIEVCLPCLSLFAFAGYPSEWSGLIRSHSYIPSANKGHASNIASRKTSSSKLTALWSATKKLTTRHCYASPNH